MGPVGDQHRFGGFVLAQINAEQAGPGRDKTGQDPVGDKLIEDGVGSQGPVLPDFLGQGAGIGRQRLEAFGQPGVLSALGLHLLLHQRGFFGGGLLLNFRHLKLAGQLLLFVLGHLVVFRELGELFLQGGGQVGLLLNFSLLRRELFPGHRGFGGTPLQFLVEHLDAGLGRGVLLLEIRLFLLQFFGLLVGLLLLQPRRLAGLGQFRLQLFAVLLLLAQRLLHDRREILRVVVPRFGQDVHLDGRRGAFILAGHLAEVRRERQQAQQQEVANDNEDAAVHDGVPRVGVAASAVVSASASSSNRRRAGRRLKILNTHTKMMPNDVDE